LSRVVTGLGAAGGIVWARDPSGQLRPEYQILPPDTDLDDSPAEAERRELVASVLADGKGKVVLPRTAQSGGKRDANPTDFLLLLCPWTVGHESAGVIQVFQRPGASPNTQQGYLEFLEVVCELVAEFHRRGQLRNYRRWAADLHRVQEFGDRVHASLDLKTTAFTVANEGRRLIGCDRLSVLVRRGGRYRVLAVSGVATLNRRASVVRDVERLTEAVCTMDEPLWYPDAVDDLPPELDRRLSAYLDESHARALAVLPLRPPRGESGPADGEAIGALVVERFHALLDEPLRWSATAVRDRSVLALRNALELDRVPLLRVFRAVGRAGWFAKGPRRPIKILALVAIVLSAIALATVPANYYVEAPGELQPARVRDVFAPVDGVVGELRIAHGQQVRADQVLLVLRQSELDFEFKRVWGELQTARKRRDAVEAEQFQDLRQSNEQRQRYAELTARKEELQALIDSLEAQYAVLQQQQAELEVGSPIAGEVLTWNPEQLLTARPVRRGQVLATIGDLEGPWRLELRIPDRRIAQVLAARRENREDLEVSFILATDPGLRLRGTLERVGMRTEIGETDGAFVLATVAVDRDNIPQLVPGAGVTAKIHCGRRAVGYVWFHDLMDAIRSWFLF